MNRSILIGRLTKDPQTKDINGIPLTTFTIAVDRIGKDSGTDFIPITAWRKTAELCEQYLSKGNMVGVDGRLNFRNYEDKQGVKRTAASVVAEEVKFLSPPPKRQEKQEEPPVFDENDTLVDDDEIPF